MIRGFEFWVPSFELGFYTVYCPYRFLFFSVAKKIGAFMRQPTQNPKPKTNHSKLRNVYLQKIRGLLYGL